MQGPMAPEDPIIPTIPKSQNRTESSQHYVEEDDSTASSASLNVELCADESGRPSQRLSRERRTVTPSVIPSNDLEVTFESASLHAVRDVTNHTRESRTEHPSTFEPPESTLGPANDDRTVHELRMWNPVWLSKTILWAFGGYFVVLLLVTALLYGFSQKYSGLSTQKQENRYGWKYGPTAVLLITTALWRQVDHAVKTLMPWRELQIGPSCADHTLLLDYISPILPVSLFTAIRNRHWAVACSIIGQILLLLTTVFSTALFSLEATEITKERADFRLETELQMPGHKNITRSSLSYISSAAARLYHGTNFLGINYTTGTSDDFVISEIQVPSLSTPILDYTTIVEGLTIDYDCEILPITNATFSSKPLEGPSSDPFNDPNALTKFYSNIITPTCNITGVTVAHHGKADGERAIQSYQGHYNFYACNTGYDYSDFVGGGDEGFAIESADLRLFLVMVDMRRAPYNEQPSWPQYLYINQMTAALCKASYFVDSFETHSPSQLNGSAQAMLRRSPGHSRRPFETFSNSFLNIAMMNTLATWGFEITIKNSSGFGEKVPPLFELMSGKDTSTLEPFLDPDRLISSSSKVFKGVAAQLLHRIAFRPVNRNITGSVTIVEDRLKVQALSAGFMLGSFALLALISFSMIYLRPHSVVPMAPTTVVSSAVILASSPILSEVLMQMNHKTNKSFWEHLKAFQFRSTLETASQAIFSIQVTEPDQNQSPPRNLDDDVKPVAWHPPAATLWFFILSISLPVALVIVLEVVQYFSDKNHGIIEIKPSDALAFVTYVPAALTLGISLLYSSIEFLTATIAPIVALKAGRPNPAAMNTTLAGKLLPHAAYLAIRFRCYAVILALMANFIGSFLSIVSSGLYKVVKVPKAQFVTVPQTDVFSLATIDAYLSTLQEDPVPLVASLVEFTNLSYPKWTHNNLALNQLDQKSVQSHSPATNGVLDIRIPGVRAKLNCTAVPTEDETPLKAQVSGSHVELQLEMALTDHRWCDSSPEGSSSPLKIWSQSYTIPSNGSLQYFGFTSGLNWELFPSLIMNGPPQVTNATKSHGCPSFTISMGWARVLRSGHLEDGQSLSPSELEYNIGTLFCYQNLERVYANVSITMPSFELDKNKYPQVEESSVVLLKNSKGSTKFNYWSPGLINGLHGDIASSPNRGPIRNFPLDTEGRQLEETFTSALLKGRNSRPVEELAGKENTAALAAAANDVYGRYMAQVLSMRHRVNITADVSPSAHNGTIRLEDAKRLQQDRGSKLAMQLALTVMVICAMVSRYLMPVKGILLHNPWSIAGIMSLLADGKLVTNLVELWQKELKSDRKD